ncbi:MAG: trypsin-like peptidase domain-containing protein [Bifidobacteriaceae bacterium]|nr:trypsin-like peptidase domain-containing protein [Bifidobacteriaceae bacterium]
MSASPTPPLPPRAASPYQAPSYALGGATASGTAPAASSAATDDRPPGGTEPADGPARPKRKSVSRAGAWAISLVAAIVVASLASGATYLLIESRPDSSTTIVTPSVDTTTGAAVDGLTSGKNVPEIPADAYDGESPQWNVVAARVQPTVVALQVSTGDFGDGALGSGVIINSEKGYVVTNNHVVAGSSTIDVVLNDGRIFSGSVLGTDPTTDLAIVELDNPPDDLVEAELGDSDEVVVGEPVMAVGNPLGLDNTVTTGIVSALNRPVATDSSEAGSNDEVVTNAIQVDAAVNPGNSGGPLFDSKGRVIGINSSIATLGSYSGEAGNIGLAFAIPVNQVKNVASQLIESGLATHPYLGVRARDTTTRVDGVTRAGAALLSVEPDTPAAAAGLTNRDVIVAVNGRPITGATSLTAWIRSFRPGDKVVLLVVQNDQANEIEVTLTTREDA